MLLLIFPHGAHELLVRVKVVLHSEERHAPQSRASWENPWVTAAEAVPGASRSVRLTCRGSSVGTQVSVRLGGRERPGLRKCSHVGA